MPENTQNQKYPEFEGRVVSVTRLEQETLLEYRGKSGVVRSVIIPLDLEGVTKGCYIEAKINEIQDNGNKLRSYDVRITPKQDLVSSLRNLPEGEKIEVREYTQII